MNAGYGAGAGKNGVPKGSTTIGMTNAGDEKDGITRATIGSGDVEIADGSGGGINRDINRQQEITRDLLTGARNANLTIDKRWFSEKGRENILDTVVKLPQNTVDAAANAGISAAGVAKYLTYDLLGNVVGNIDDPVKMVKTAIDQFKHGAIENQIGQIPRIRDVLNNQENMTPENFAAIKDDLIKIFNANGVDVQDITLFTDKDDRQAFYTTDSNGNRMVVAIGIIDKYTDQQLTGQQLTLAMHHETTDHASGKRTEDYANQIGLYGQESRDFFNALRFADYTNDSYLDRNSYIGLYGDYFLIQQGNSLSLTISPEETVNWGRAIPLLDPLVRSVERGASAAGQWVTNAGHQVLAWIETTPYVNTGVRFSWGIVEPSVSWTTVPAAWGAILKGGYEKFNLEELKEGLEEFSKKLKKYNDSDRVGLITDFSYYE
ncbi:MAG: hypothetical protein FWF99_00845 [Desulfovibrionaceae bacterium]|nr:hypothetical protein [Desulfovibrionaceae bacterium]